jgi:hypothetical protein
MRYVSESQFMEKRRHLDDAYGMRRQLKMIRQAKKRRDKT